MSNLVRQGGVAAQRPAIDVRFAGKSLEQLLTTLAVHLATMVRRDLDVAVLVRDRNGGRTWGRAALADLNVVAASIGHIERAIEMALDEGRVWHADDTLAVPVAVAERVIGAVIVTARGSRLIDAAAVSDAREAADAWALTIDNAITFAATHARLKNLEVAMQGRAVIEQAKGIVMERHRCDAQEAFEILRQHSQHGDVKLSALAAQLVAEAGA